jgi:hypothetical protein
MAIKVSGTTVIDDSRVLQNIFQGSISSSILTLTGGGTIDCSQGIFFRATVGSSTTFSFANVPATSAYSCVLEITHSSGTIAWPNTVVWPGDVAPTTTTGKTHLFVFITDDGGARWRGAFLTNYTN